MSGVVGITVQGEAGTITISEEAYTEPSPDPIAGFPGRVEPGPTVTIYRADGTSQVLGLGSEALLMLLEDAIDSWRKARL